MSIQTWVETLVTAQVDGPTLATFTTATSGSTSSKASPLTEITGCPFTVAPFAFAAHAQLRLRTGSSRADSRRPRTG